MHQPIKDHLETFLSDSTGDFTSRHLPESQDFHAHLAACPSCAEEIRILTDHSRLLQASRHSEPFEIRPGFYARVIDRIQQQRRPDSFWSVFLEPTFGKRLAYACTALVLLLGSYLVKSEPSDQVTPPSVIVSQEQTSPNLDGAVQSKDRDAVLVSLASYRE